MKEQNAIGRLKEVVFSFCKGLDTPRSLKLWLLVREDEWDQVARFKVYPHEYLTADSFAVDYGLCNLLRKTAGLPSVADTRQAAIRSFAATESQCKDTNERVRKYLGGFVKPTNPRVEEIITIAQQKIGAMLGHFDIVSAQRACSWGNGATSDLSKSKAYLDTKMLMLPFSCTPSAWKHAATVIKTDHHWKDAIIMANTSYEGCLIDGTRGNVFDTVPKTVLTDRCIAKEPRLNGFLQKGAGKFIRGVLRKHGCDIKDQSRNQNLAYMARDLGLATLDLESASDTVADEVVKLLLPNPVYEYLNDIRCKETLIDGNWVRNEKFSSMGNAFTFELETLIFWALSFACSKVHYRSIFGVYGDDIIVHRDVAPLLIDSLSFLGFTLNKEKSFVEGEFFESCGKHYYGNFDVTPVYQKCVPVTDMDALRFCNRILRFAHRLGGFHSFDKRIEAAWRCAVRVYRLQKYAGPIVGDRDDYLESPAGTYPERSGSSHRYRVVAIVERYREIPADDAALLALWLRMSDTGELSERLKSNFIRKVEARCWSFRGRLGWSLMEAIDDLFPERADTTESGNLLSRVTSTVTLQHRWVCPSALAALSW